MPGNTFGRILRLTTFGESHGPALGAVVDGCPAGVALALDDLRSALARRRPGQSAIASPRAEADEPEILSGVLGGVTLGTPIAVIVRNTDQRSSDYANLPPRPGHADLAWERKYGVRDARGGGRSSGRETLARVIGGAIAERILPADVRIVGFTRAIGTHTALDVPDALDRAAVDAHATRCPDAAVAARISDDLAACIREGDSRGGIVELRIDGVPAGLGQPVFQKAKSELAAALMSIGAVTGVTLGDAFDDAALAGREFHADEGVDAEGWELRAHGIQGGITNGRRITLRCSVKPVSTIGSAARAGRHDPCIVPRVIPVVEAMAALVLADLYLASRLDRL